MLGYQGLILLQNTGGEGLREKYKSPDRAGNEETTTKGMTNDMTEKINLTGIFSGELSSPDDSS